jgi:hypothetical protein
VPNPATQLAAYLSSDQVGADTAPKPPPRVTALQVRKPSDQEFVRVKAGEQLVMPLFKLKNGGRLFLYKPCVEPYLDPRHYRDYRLVLAMPLRAVIPFIWALPVPQDDLGYSWHASGDEVARDAERAWVKVKSDMAGGAYVSEPAEDVLPEPAWPDQPFEQLVLLAFRNSRLDDAGHPVLRNLRGAL